MWIFTKHGFLSVVQHNSMENHFQVKSRVIDPLEILWPDHEIEIISWADYRFRITIRKEEAVSIFVDQIKGIDYTSFKNECENDEWYHHALTRIWGVMYNFQQRMELISRGWE